MPDIFRETKKGLSKEEVNDSGNATQAKVVRKYRFYITSYPSKNSIFDNLFP